MHVSRLIARLIAPTLTLFSSVSPIEITRIFKILAAFANATCALSPIIISGFRMPFFDAKFL